MKKLRRNNQQIRLKRRESHALQRQGEIAVGSGKRNVVGYPNDVHWPQVVVAQTFPQEPRRDRLAVMHVSFRWVVSYYSVD